MRVLLVGSSRGWRGTETHLVALASSLMARGHAVAALTFPASPIADALTARSVPVFGTGFRNAADLRGGGTLHRAISKFRPSVVTASFGHEYWPVSLIGRSRGVRVLLFRHLNTRLKRWSAAVLPRVADGFVAVSQSVKAHLVSSGVHDQRVRVLYNPIDTDSFVPARDEERARARAELGIPTGSFVVGFVGSFGKVKGASLFAAMLNGLMRRHSNVVALWVGETERREAVRSQISPEHERRHFFFNWASDVRPFYGAMDVLAVPSQWQEPFGRVAVEAAACGVPVIASRVGGLPEAVIDGSTGWIVPPDDGRAWSGTLSHLVESPDELRRAGAAGRAFVSERFSLERIGADFEQLVQGAESTPTD